VLLFRELLDHIDDLRKEMRAYGIEVIFERVIKITVYY
jgi:hypothetical protein